MKAVRTKTCHRYGHLEFRVTYDPALVVVEDAEWFMDWLEKSVAEGVRYSARQTCQVGWVVLQLRQREDGELTLWEPDMQHSPIEWVEGVSYTLAHLRVQKDVVESVLDADNLSFPSMRESAIICTRLRPGEDVVMERVDHSGTDSGWFCGCQGEEHDHNNATEVRKVSLYEAVAVYAPQIVPYLALPPGTLVGVGEGAPIMFHDGKPLTFRRGSYLSARYPGL